MLDIIPRIQRHEQPQAIARVPGQVERQVDHQQVDGHQDDQFDDACAGQRARARGLRLGAFDHPRRDGESPRSDAEPGDCVVTLSFAGRRQVVAGHGLVGHRAPTEAAGLNPAGRAQFHAQLRVFEHTCHLLRDAVSVQRGNQQGSFAAHLGQRRRCRRYHRGATRHRFQHGQAEAFVQARKSEEPGGIVPER